MAERKNVKRLHVGVFASLLTLGVGQPPEPASLLAICGPTIIARTFVDPESGCS
jgi:hypothetical protein